MTEKRFKYVEFTKNILSFDDNGVCKFFKEQEFEDWLNELNDKNIELKHQVIYLEDRLDDMIILKKENDELKKENEEIVNSILLWDIKAERKS